MIAINTPFCAPLSYYASVHMTLYLSLQAFNASSVDVTDPTTFTYGDNGWT